MNYTLWHGRSDSTYLSFNISFSLSHEDFVCFVGMIAVLFMFIEQLLKHRGNFKRGKNMEKHYIKLKIVTF